MSDKKAKVDKEVTKEAETEVIDEKDVDNEITVLEAENEKLKDKLLRNSAELENFKRRTNEEKHSFMKYASQEILLELITILDNFDRALESMDDVDESTFAGIKMIYEQLNKVLNSHGVEVIECVGEKFDPSLHQAVMTGSDSNYDSGIIIEELQRGYKYKDKILRPSMVKVNE